MLLRRSPSSWYHPSIAFVRMEYSHCNRWRRRGRMMIDLLHHFQYLVLEWWMTSIDDAFLRCYLSHYVSLLPVLRPIFEFGDHCWMWLRKARYCSRYSRRFGHYRSVPSFSYYRTCTRLSSKVPIGRVTVRSVNSSIIDHRPSTNLVFGPWFWGLGLFSTNKNEVC